MFDSWSCLGLSHGLVFIRLLVDRVDVLKPQDSMKNAGGSSGSSGSSLCISWIRKFFLQALSFERLQNVANVGSSHK